jgi:signal transduction histidine kinase
MTLTNDHEQILHCPARLQALFELNLLDTAEEPAFDRLTRLAARVLNVPVALVSLVDDHRQFFKSCVGLPEPYATERETPLSHSFCQYAVSSREPLIIEDARQHPLVRNNLAIPDINVIAYAGIPLITTDGYALGSFCVIDGQPRRWTEADIALLTDLAASVMTEIELRAEIAHRKQAEGELQERVKLLTILNQLDRELNHSLTIEHVVSVALDAALRLSNTSSGLIALMGDGLHVAHRIGGYDEAFLQHYLNRDDTPLADALESGEIRVSNHMDSTTDTPLQAQSRAQVIAPMLTREALVGVMVLEGRRAGCFTPDVITFVRLLAGRVAIAIENARLYQLLQSRLEEIQAAHAELSTLEQIKSDMIRIAAHDLRNPLGVISGYIELLQEMDAADFDETGRAMVEMMHGGVRQMQRITNDVLSLQRIETSALHRERVELGELARRIIQEQLECCGAKHRFSLALADEPLYVQGDPIQLQEVVVNLIGNAIKYTPESGSITIRLAASDGFAAFEVEDTGYGVPEAMQARLFHPFYRARTRETRGIDGTGLGLYLVKRVVERYGGGVLFQSVYGVGSLFGFALPLA